MKRLAKAVLKCVWRSTGAIRRPVTRRYAAFLKDCVRPTELAYMVHVVDESNALLDQVVRELVRLQRQTEHLQQLTEELSADRGLRTAPDECGHSAWPPIAHRKAI